MDFVALVEKAVLAATMMQCCTDSRKRVFHVSEIAPVMVFYRGTGGCNFVLIALFGNSVVCKERGGLVGLNLVTERLPKLCKKPVIILITLFSVAFMGILFITVWTRC